MGELTAMGLVGVECFSSLPLWRRRYWCCERRGELLAAAMGFVGLIGGCVMVRVVKHLEVVDQRRKREEIILSR
jgi:hypothetical protein